MSLINKKALFKQNQFSYSVEVTIVDSFVSNGTQFKLIVMNSSGELYQASIQDLTIIDDNEWSPNWETIKYDYLLMDASGSWYSYSTPHVYFNNSEWCRDPRYGGTSMNRESHITHKHPNPEKSVYTRPKGI